MKRQGYLLATTIMAGIETILLVLLLMVIILAGTSQEFMASFQEGFASTSGSYSAYAVIKIIFILITLYSIVKFIFVFLGYRKNSKGFIITSIVLTAIPVLNYLISIFTTPASILFLVYEGVMLGLLIAGLVNLKKMKNFNQNNFDEYDNINIEMNKY